MRLLFPSDRFLFCFSIIMMVLVTGSVLASPSKTVIKLSPQPLTQHTVELPLNEYHALAILALKKSVLVKFHALIMHLCIPLQHCRPIMINLSI